MYVRDSLISNPDLLLLLLLSQSEIYRIQIKKQEMNDLRPRSLPACLVYAEYESDN